MKFDKQRWLLYSLQALAIFVIGPALFHLCRPAFEYFKGNREAVAYTDTYVQGWDSLIIKLPDNIAEDFFNGDNFHTGKSIDFYKNRATIFAEMEVFYISQYKKYFAIVWIYGIDFFSGLHGRHYDAAKTQQSLRRDRMELSVYVNKKQWRDKSYGTKEKPVPVFLHRIISGDDIEERNKQTWKRDSLYPKGHFVEHYLPPHAVRRMRNTPDSINRKFAMYYLRYLLPEDEFDRLFKEE